MTDAHLLGRNSQIPRKIICTVQTLDLPIDVVHSSCVLSRRHPIQSCHPSQVCASLSHHPFSRYAKQSPEPRSKSNNSLYCMSCFTPLKYHLVFKVMCLQWRQRRIFLQNVKKICINVFEFKVAGLP